MLDVADDHKSSGANVPFTTHSPLISDPIQPGEGGVAINKRGNVTAALRCHGGRRVFSWAGCSDDKGGELEP